MEQDFLTSLKGAGITTVTSDILKEEHILNFDVFASLEEEHFTVLRSKIKIGQHALLLRLWHQRNRMERSSENPLSPTPSTASSSLMAVKSPSPAVRDESIRDNIKELADLYKKRGSGMPQQNVKGGDPRRMTIILGGMLYDMEAGKGFRRRSIPGPNPQKVELSRKSSLDDIFMRAKELYFGDKANLKKMNLADSSGMIVNVNPCDWNLEEYYKDNDYKPSRHKLYVVYDTNDDLVESNIFGSSEEEGQLEPSKNYRERDKNDSIYTQGYTLPIIVSCLDCNQKFRTYVPNTDCLLLDGNVVFYKEPQTLCPECTGGIFLSINEDLFPHMVHNQ